MRLISHGFVTILTEASSMASAAGWVVELQCCLSGESGDEISAAAWAWWPGVVTEDNTGGTGVMVNEEVEGLAAVTTVNRVGGGGAVEICGCGCRPLNSFSSRMLLLLLLLLFVVGGCWLSLSLYSICKETQKIQDYEDDSLMLNTCVNLYAYCLSLCSKKWFFAFSFLSSVADASCQIIYRPTMRWVHKRVGLCTCMYSHTHADQVNKKVAQTGFMRTWTCLADESERDSHSL